MGVWAHWKKSHVKWLKSDGLRWGCRVWCDPSTHTQRHLWSPHGCLAQLGQPCLSSVTASKSWDSVHKAFKSTNELLLLEFKAGTKRDMRFIGNMDKEGNPEACAADSAFAQPNPGQNLAEHPWGRAKGACGAAVICLWCPSLSLSAFTAPSSCTRPSGSLSSFLSEPAFLSKTQSPEDYPLLCQNFSPELCFSQDLVLWQQGFQIN